MTGPLIVAKANTAKRDDACNPDRFCERVMADYEMERAYCRCCGKRIAPQSDAFDDTPDGYCRWCELGHPARVKVERPRLFTLADGTRGMERGR